jgi:HSP20 family protein
MRWQPFSELMSLRDAMDRLFDEMFFQPTRTGRAGAMTLPIDMHETDKDLIVRAPLPGVKPEDVEITVSGDTLTIRGELKRDEKVQRENYFYQEWRYGQFTRTVALPKAVQADKASAHFEDGVLTLTLPKAEEAKVRRIEIKQGRPQ